MVTETEYNGNRAYECEECGFHFAQENKAEKCENYCSENSSCSNEITRESMERTG